MSQEIRRELIRKNLGIRPINHGQVYTFQIALPEADKKEIPFEQYQAIEQSLLEHQSNLVSLIIRRTKAYEDDDIEYEIVYGADWLQVAKALEIEMLWAWVFDMTDEQTLAAKTEMAQLFGSAAVQQTVESPSTNETTSNQADSIAIENLIDKKLKLTAESIKNVLVSSLDKFKEDFNEKLRNIQYRLDSLSDGLSEIPELSQQMQSLEEQLKTIGSRSRKLPSFEGEKVNLLAAQNQEIASVLGQVGTQTKQINAALETIVYWKQSGRNLSWQNLERSAKAKKGSEYKIEGFAEATYDRLQLVGEIPE